MNPRAATVRRRIIWAVVIATVLVVVVVGTLSFVDSYAIDEAGKRCAVNFAKTKWPMYLGCAMASHEGLAAGLIGSAGALFAAWLAFDAVQEQIGEEKERLRRQQADAKQAAVICIIEPIDEAASTLAVVNRALAAKDAASQKRYDDLVTLGTAHLKSTLQSFAIRESATNLAIEDRVLYNLIVNSLSAFLNLSTLRPANVPREKFLEIQQKALTDIGNRVARFDSALADLFEKKSKIE